MELEEPEFVEAFWKWFDSLPVSEKERFWNYQSDMAKLFFYNKCWVKRQLTNNPKRDISK